MNVSDRRDLSDYHRFHHKPLKDEYNPFIGTGSAVLVGMSEMMPQLVLDLDNDNRVYR